MNEPYENLYLGAFIFALGVAAGKKNLPVNDSCAQLLQQTPGDKPIGDLLAVWGGRSFIFEFKRRESGLQTEHQKRYCKKSCPEDCDEHRNFIFDNLSCSANEMQLRKSLKCHFAAFGGDATKPSLSFMPYAEIKNSEKQGAREDLSNFTNKMMSGKSLGLNKKEFSEYYDFLLKCVDHHGGSLSGIVVNVSEEGDMNSVNIADLPTLVGNILESDNVPAREPYEPPTENLRIKRLT